MFGLGNQSKLANYILNLDQTPYKKQKQMPNPTLIRNVGQEFIAFTDKSSNPKNSYPSIFFFNLEEKKVEWEISGGEVLVNLN